MKSAREEERDRSLKLLETVKKLVICNTCNWDRVFHNKVVASDTFDNAVAFIMLDNNGLLFNIRLNVIH